MSFGAGFEDQKTVAAKISKKGSSVGNPYARCVMSWLMQHCGYYSMRIATP